MSTSNSGLPDGTEDFVGVKAKELEKRLSEYLKLVDAEIPQDSFTWERPGQEGAIKTQFFKRYD